MQNSFISDLQNIFQENSNNMLAAAQAKYMKNKFQFLGITKPKLKKLSKDLIKNLKINNESELIKILEELWLLEYREYHYIALEILNLNKFKKIWSPNILNLILKLIETNSWWDTVDFLASNSFGFYIQKYPEQINLANQLILSDNFWLRRTAILFQLKYKHKTDHELLFSLCKVVMHEKEFFIRKSIGWALREYSKTNKEHVKDFVNLNINKLSALSIREASKYL